MVQESKLGAYLGPGPELEAGARRAAADPHFDVFDGEGYRLILGKCSRLPDDEDLAVGRYGIDFHRALPPFKGSSGFTCRLDGRAVAVNAYNYARCLPRALRFREFSANLAFAARTRAEYRAKRLVYRRFYDHLYHHPGRITLAAPHCGEVRRAPDKHHPFPQTEIDAWTGRVMVRCLRRQPRYQKRVLVSLHSTDHFGPLLDIGDFGLPRNDRLPAVLDHLRREFSEEISAIRPAYREHIMPYTQARLKWFESRFGPLSFERLASKSTAALFEIRALARVLESSTTDMRRIHPATLLKSMETFWERPDPPLVTLNGVFSGRKTARLLNLADHLHQAGIHTAVQVECSRFLARHHPDLAAAVICKLIERLSLPAESDAH